MPRHTQRPIKRYIQRYDRKDRFRETVDEVDSKDFESRSEMFKEAERLVREYQAADPEGEYYSSQVPCRDWAEES